MKEATGNLLKAIQCFGGGGGGGSINVPSVGSAIGQTTKAIGSSVIPAFNSFVSGNPLLAQLGQQGLAAGTSLGNYAQSILNDPYNVPKELLNYATQSARGAFQSRGNLNSGAALAGELLNREQVRQQRISQAAGLAGQAEQLEGYPVQTQTGAFATLANPAYALAGSIFGDQTQAQIAQAAQGASNKAGTGSLIGSGIGAIGSIVGAVAL